MSENKFLRFFEKNGLLKLVGSFLLLALIVWLFNVTEWNIFKYLVWIPSAYIIVAFLLFFAAGIIGAINDYKKKKD